MKKALALLALSVAPLAVMQAQAATVEIEWQNPEKYRDIEAGNMSKAKFQEEVFGKLAAHFQEAADEYLPDGQTLEIEVTDVDLAGYVEYFIPRFEQGLRVVDDPYFPRLDFTYELRDEQDQVIKRGEEKATDSGSRFWFGSLQGRDDPLFLEKRLIDRWFRDTFQDGEES